MIKASLTSATCQTYGQVIKLSQQQIYKCTALVPWFTTAYQWAYQQDMTSPHPNSFAVMQQKLHNDTSVHSNVILYTMNQHLTIYGRK